MIQRIQTIYLFLVVTLGTLLCFNAPIEYLVSNTTTKMQMLASYSEWPLLIISCIIPLLTLVNIFLYKHRILQVRINTINVFLSLGYYAILAFYVWVLKQTYGESIHYAITLWASIPLISTVLLMMATRRILKDEALVRAADRIR